MKRVLLAVALLVGATAAASAAAAPPVLSEPLRQRILAHGPWPPPPALDPGNAWAGRPETVWLGQRLFFEPRLSPDGRLSCASCHLPSQAFADGRARSHGRTQLDRNAPSLWNAGHERWWGWDGAADSLWSQAIRPLLDERELASHPTHVRRLVTLDAELACRWQRSFGAPPPDDDETLLVLSAKALGAFVGSLVSAPATFDRFRQALSRGDTRAAARYPAAALRGLQLFVGAGKCNLCHAGPRFSNGEFGDIGAGFFVRSGEVDSGRHGGIQQLLASRFNLLGPHADDAAEAAVKTRHVHLQHRNFGEFKVPSLRNVALTAPYLHDGKVATLAGMVRHYSELNLDRLHADGERILEPLRLSARQQRDLLAFLHTLSDPAARAWQPRSLPRCE